METNHNTIQETIRKIHDLYGELEVALDAGGYLDKIEWYDQGAREDLNTLAQDLYDLAGE